MKHEGAEVQFVGGVPQHKANRVEFGIPLGEVTDLKWLREAVEGLWTLLDDIDTVGDLAKDNDDLFRRLIAKTYVKRNEWCASDGFGLFRQGK